MIAWRMARVGWVFGAFAVLVLTCVVSAHPYHVSIAEMELNRDTRRFEVALKIHSGDLESSLEARHGERIDLERTQAVDEKIADYLGESFWIEGSDGPAEFIWVGKELELRSLWVYFEIVAPRNLAGMSLINRLFFELQDDQMNSVNLVGVRFASGDRSHHFHRDDPRAVLSAVADPSRASSFPEGGERAAMVAIVLWAVADVVRRFF